jgi:hypothetical protein
MQGLWLRPEFSLYRDPDHFAISQLSAAMCSRDGLNAVFLSSISRMSASAAASFRLSVAISAKPPGLRGYAKPLGPPQAARRWR